MGEVGRGLRGVFSGLVGKTVPDKFVVKGREFKTRKSKICTFLASSFSKNKIYFNPAF